MTKNSGTLFFNSDINRMDILFDDGETYGGLHCGTCLDAKVDGQWVPTRIEYSDKWFLVDMPSKEMGGLKIRI